ncbi:MAG: flagellar export protein FliJ [Burkholderiales bacterium]|nr:flagellar export protein FliJ [Burkholderiales bacterium]
MTRSLLQMLQLAERDRDQVLAALRQAEAMARQARDQADQLEQYRGEVRQRHPATGGRSATIEMLRVHFGFAQRLDQALTQQQATTSQAESRLEALRAELLARETRVAAVRKLIERRQAEQQRGAARLEQRRSDEAAQRPRNHAGAAPSWQAVTGY